MELQALPFNDKEHPMKYKTMACVNVMKMKPCLRGENWAFYHLISEELPPQCDVLYDASIPMMGMFSNSYLSSTGNSMDAKGSKLQKTNV